MSKATETIAETGSENTVDPVDFHIYTLSLEIHCHYNVLDTKKHINNSYINIWSTVIVIWFTAHVQSLITLDVEVSILPCFYSVGNVYIPDGIPISTKIQEEFFPPTPLFNGWVINKDSVAALKSCPRNNDSKDGSTVGLGCFYEGSLPWILVESESD